MSQHPSVFLQASHIHKEARSGENTILILQDVDITIKSGESIAILGASGSGKTTLLTLLAGLDLPTSGDIIFKGQFINTMSEEERATLRANQVGFIFQSFQLLSTLTALENVMLPLEIQYIPYEQARNQAKLILEKVGLDKRLQHYPSQLSGGEQQRVAIARAFVTQPSIVFADEMTGNLDTKTGNLISDLLFELNAKEKTTLVLVTHDDNLAKRCEKRFLLIEGMLKPC